MGDQRRTARAGKARKAGWNAKRRRDDTRRKKISTTIAPEGYAFLESLIQSGKAENLAESLDIVLEEMRRAENRARLERMMEAYYENASPEAIAEENEIAEAFSKSAHEINVDD
jgi:hypothetical protein